MCIKVTDNETDTIKALMVTSLNTIISDVFEINIDEIEITYRLKKDLHMNDEQEHILKQSILEYFDGLELKLSRGYTIQNLYNDVVFNNL
ncbi:MAG: hypothetical protein KZQ83_11205 [gamma proteobacterium symbiont of Taylorina sp.]|nr:hypothetical protein [gamma proteobacterium symbiont of Taylorina sp.]